MEARRRLVRSIGLVAVMVCVLGPWARAEAAATLSIAPTTWNVVGLDSNRPLDGPKDFPVGVRVCNSGTTASGPVAVTLVWDTTPSPNHINLLAGLPNPLTLPAIAPGACSDAYFQAVVTQDAAAYLAARRFHVVASDSVAPSVQTSVRELFVEYLVSQNRNSVTDVLYGPDPATLTSVAAGGSMSLTVGRTYALQVKGQTATQGYNQIEEFITLPGTIFQILTVSQTYSAYTGPYVKNPNDKLYGDACLWDADPAHTNTYRSCVGGDYKAGGVTNTTYLVKVIAGGGTTAPLNTLIYDFSGSSFHYNSDFKSAVRYAVIADPGASTITKSFAPSTITAGGTSVMQVTVTNPTDATIGGYSFTDTFPGGLVAANPASVQWTGCGAATVDGGSGLSYLNLENATIAPSSSCVVTVRVTSTLAATYHNTTGPLYADGASTGKTAAADLTVQAAPPPPAPTCALPVAAWTSFAGTSPVAPDTKATDVPSAALSVVGLTAAQETVKGNPTPSYRTYPHTSADVPATAPYLKLVVDTRNFVGVTLQFDAASSVNGPTSAVVYVVDPNSTPANQVQQVGTALTLVQAAQENQWRTSAVYDFTGKTSTTGTTEFRIYATGATNTSGQGSLLLDNVVFTGCKAPAPPTLAKSFSPATVAVGKTATLTFTVTNPNATASLSGVSFSDALPAGLRVAAAPAASASGCGSASWSPAPLATTLDFGKTTAGTIAAAGTCTASVAVEVTAAGLANNVTTAVTSTEGGTNGGPTGIGQASVTGLLPPEISKFFSPNPIKPQGVSTLTLTITNPDPSTALSGVAVTDPLPTVGAATLAVAATPNASTTGCGSPTFAPSPGATTLTLTGASLAAGGTCTVTVDVTAPSGASGDFVNATGNVSHVVNGSTVEGTGATATLTVIPPVASLGLLKEVGTSATGPWGPFAGVTVGANVYYRFTIENTGEVALTNLQLDDAALNPLTSADCSFVGTSLNPQAVATCVVGPKASVYGVNTNTATATGSNGANPVPTRPSSATYAATYLKLIKSGVVDLTVVPPSDVANPGDTITYGFQVQNTGTDVLQDLTNVSVTDPLLPSFTCSVASLPHGQTLPCTGTGTANVYTLTAADISLGVVPNLATATGTIGAEGTETATAGVIKTFDAPSADVSVVKDVDNPTPYVGGTVRFTLAAANAGPSGATGVAVADTLPSGYSYVTSSTATGSYSPATGVWTIGNLASGGSALLTIDATVLAAGDYGNTAVIAAEEYDPVPANNTSTHGVTPIPLADVWVTKTVDNPLPALGGTVTFTVTAGNNGPSVATNLAVVDVLPGGYALVSATPAVGSWNPATSTWSVAHLANGGNAQLVIVATVLEGDSYANTATVSAAELDPVLTNNTATVTPAPQLPALTITKSHAGSVSRGQQGLVYTVTVGNSGPGATFGTITIVDILPQGLTFVSATGAGWSCSSGQVVGCTSSATIPAGGSSQILITVNVAADAPDQMVNTVNASGGGASGPPVQASDPTPIGIPNVPTLDWKGLVALSALLAAAGVAALTRRSLAG